MAVYIQSHMPAKIRTDLMVPNIESCTFFSDLEKIDWTQVIVPKDIDTDLSMICFSL